MKALVVLGAGLLFSLAACKDEPKNKNGDRYDGGDSVLSDTHQERIDNENRLREERDAFAIEMDTAASRADRRIEDLERRSKKEKGEARKKMDEEIADLKVRRDELREDARAAKSEMKEDWNTFKARVRARMDSLDRKLND